MFATISSKDYQVLDYEKPEFDEDYIVFKKSVSETETELHDFMDKCISMVPYISEALKFLARYIYIH